MLELRPNCEWCDRDLPPNSTEATIYTYKCTHCTNCVETVLHNVCPTCSGGFVPRPIRPCCNHREGKRPGLESHPASNGRMHSKWTAEQVSQKSSRLKYIPLEKR